MMTAAEDDVGQLTFEKRVPTGTSDEVAAHASRFGDLMSSMFNGSILGGTIVFCGDTYPSDDESVIEIGYDT